MKTILQVIWQSQKLSWAPKLWLLIDYQGLLRVKGLDLDLLLPCLPSTMLGFLAYICILLIKMWTLNFFFVFYTGNVFIKINPLLKQVFANVLNIWSLLGQEEYNVGRIVLSATILYSLTKKHSNIWIPWHEKWKFINLK